MKRTDNQFGIELKSETNVKYNNDRSALLAALDLAAYFTENEYLVNTSFSKKSHTYEVTVHFDIRKPIKTPNYLSFTNYYLTSYNSGQVRVARFKFIIDGENDWED